MFIISTEVVYTGVVDLNGGQETLGLGVTLLNVGTGVMVGAAIIFLTAVVWLYKSKFRDLKAMLMVVMALVMLPAGVRLAQEKTGLPTQASVETRVENVQVVRVREGETMVYFTTPEEAIAYVEYTDAETGKKTPYFPDYPIARQRAHAVLVRGIGVKGGGVTFVVDGQKVNFQGKPVEVR